MEQIKDLSERGFYIGAHSKDHPHFAMLGPKDRLTQFRESMEYLRTGLDLRDGIFSFPFSDDGIPADFFSAMRAPGMPVLDASFGTAGLKKDPEDTHFQRIQMETRRASALRIIKGEYLYYLGKGPVGKNKLIRK